jgi:hypothetical protein
MCTRTARIARRRPRRSSACAACAAEFISARTAIIRYRRRRTTRTARRAKFGPASSTCSVLNRTRRGTDDWHRAGEGQNRPAEPCLQHPSAGDAGTDGCRIREKCARRVPSGRLAHQTQVTHDKLCDKITIAPRPRSIRRKTPHCSRCPQIREGLRSHWMRHVTSYRISSSFGRMNNHDLDKAGARVRIWCFVKFRTSTAVAVRLR